MSEINRSTGFFNQMKLFGLKNMINAADFRIALLSLLLLLLDRYYDTRFFATSSEALIIAFSAGAASLFALTITALSIILSFSSSNFVKFLKEHDQFGKFLFFFWLNNVSFLMVILFSTLYLSLSQKNGDLYIIRESVYVFTASLFVYSLIGTFQLLETVIRFGHFLIEYDDKLNN